MHYIISATMRISLGTLMLIGVCLFVLLGLLPMSARIVPYADSGPLSAKLLKQGILKTYNGFPHGMLHAA
jgi:hypothetical protein